MALAVSRIRTNSITDYALAGGRCRSHSFRCLTTLGALPDPLEDEVVEGDGFEECFGPSAMSRKTFSRRLSISIADQVKQFMNKTGPCTRHRTPSLCVPNNVGTETDAAEEDLFQDKLMWGTHDSEDGIRTRRNSQSVYIVSVDNITPTVDGVKENTSADEVWLHPAAPPTSPATSSPAQDPHPLVSKETPYIIVDDADASDLFPYVSDAAATLLSRSNHLRLAGSQGEDIIVTQGNEDEVVDIMGDTDKGTARGRPSKIGRPPKKRIVIDAELELSPPGAKRGRPAEGDSGGGTLSEAQQRRYQHNVMERQRRNGLNNAFDALRRTCCISEDENVAKVVILRNALDIIATLKGRCAELDRKKEMVLNGP